MKKCHESKNWLPVTSHVGTRTGRYFVDGGMITVTWKHHSETTGASGDPTKTSADSNYHLAQLIIASFKDDE